MQRIICGFSGALLVFGASLPALAQQFALEEGSDRYKKTVPSTYGFLKIAPSARVSAMGEAYTAVAEGVDAIYWNPAGIASIQKAGFTFGYTDWIGDSKFYSGAIAINVGYGLVGGISVRNFKPADIEETTPLSPDGTGRTLDLGDTAVGFNVARQMTDKLLVGGSLTYVQSTLDQVELKSVAVSAGTLLHTGYRSLRIGMAMKNLGNAHLGFNARTNLPIVFHVGSSMEVVGELGDPLSVTASVEGAYFTDFWQRWNVGAEAWINNMIALRAGKKFRYDTEGWSVGGGLKGEFDGRQIALDFSYSDMGDSGFKEPIRVTFSGSF